MTSSIVVIGGGLIGTTTAWYLRERGFDVTVIERREGSGLETSFANGGLVTPSQSDPWNAPGTLAYLLRWLGHENSPLLLRPQALPGMLRWGLDFLRSSRSTVHRRATEDNLRLGLYSVRALADLRARLNLQYDSLSTGTLKIFRARAALDKSLALAESLEPLGLQYRRLTTAEATALEPVLASVSGELVGGIHYPLDESGDAYSFTQEMTRRAQAAGVRFAFSTRLQTIEVQGTHITSLRTDKGELQAACYLLAAGSESPRIARMLGMYLPVYPVKGYSVTVPLQEKQPLRIPLVDFEQKVVITPLGSRVRIAGTAEFTGYDTTLNTARGGNILRQAIGLLPQLTGPVEQGRAIHWAGLRPMTCDGPPVLGPSPYANLFFNTGHGPLGWTLCAGSARLVADMIVGRQPEIDTRGLLFTRFTH